MRYVGFLYFQDTKEKYYAADIGWPVSDKDARRFWFKWTARRWLNRMNNDLNIKGEIHIDKVDK